MLPHTEDALNLAPLTPASKPQHLPLAETDKPVLR